MLVVRSSLRSARLLQFILKQEFIDWAKLCELCLQVGTEGVMSTNRAQAWVLGLGLLPPNRGAWDEIRKDMAEEFEMLKHTCMLLLDWEGDIGEPPLRLDEIFIISHENIYQTVPAGFFSQSQEFLRSLAEVFVDVIIFGKPEAYFGFSAYVLLLLQKWGGFFPSNELPFPKPHTVEKSIFKLVLHMRGLGSEHQKHCISRSATSH